MKEMTATWMERAGDVRDIQNVIQAEYHIVTEEPPPKLRVGEKTVPGGIETRGDDDVGGRTAGGGGERGKPAPTTSETQKGDNIPKSRGGPSAAAAEPEGDGFHIDLEWLDEALQLIKWSEDTTKSWLATKFKLDTKGDLKNDVLPRCTKEQAAVFVKEIQNRVAQQQMNL
ncbi:hypothetical protein ES703_38349 [subsurface metagenome]